MLMVFCISMSNQAKAQDGPFGIGISIGDYTGISYKYWLTPDYALNGVVNGTIREHGSNLYAHWDMLVHRHNMIEVDSGSIPLYYGFGFFARFHDGFDNDAGLRLPVGIEYLLEGDKLGVFIESAPTYQFTGNNFFTFQGAIGFRYYL